MKVWSVKKCDKQLVKQIKNEYDLPGILATILQVRGITKREDIEDYFSNEYNFSDPFLMKDMDKAVERIIRAVEDGEKICVYGDYDADGVTSTALLYSYLYDTLGADAFYYIPSRMNEGYGMNKNAVDYIHSQGATLIITVDNGISAREEIAYANTLSIDTVVTDHHQPSGELPPAVAVVDAHRQDDTSPFKDFCGAGLAFKLVMALEGEYADIDSLIENFGDIAALGTVGDIVPLRGENRILARAGISHIGNSDRIGINALKECAGVSEKETTATTLSFYLVPRINACGRLSHSSKSVKLLLSEDINEAENLAEQVNQYNSQRKGIEQKILDEINTMISQRPNITNDKVIVISGNNWHHGVIGIVAAKIKEVYDKPVIIIGVDENGVARGSGRSVEGFSLCDAVFACSEYLTHCGGHPMAVGLGIKKENIENFRRAINDYCNDIQMPYSILDIDCKLNPAHLSLDLLDSLSFLEPCGESNPAPLFGLFNMYIEGVIPVSNGKHIRLNLKREGAMVTAMYFNMPYEDFFYRVGDTVDVAVTLDRNVFNGQENLSVIIKDIKFSDSDNPDLIDNLRIFDKFAVRKPLTQNEARKILPDRNDFGIVYTFLRKNNGYHYGEYALMKALGYKIKAGKLKVILFAMKELGLIDWKQGLYTSYIEVKNSGKVDLEKSIFIKKLKEVL